MEYTTFNTEIDVSKLNKDIIINAIEYINKNIITLEIQKTVLLEELRKR